MDKDKIKKLLEDVDICFLGYERNGCKDLIQMGLERLHEAQEEFSKPSWISVEDKLPPYDENVLVYEKGGHYDITMRLNINDYSYDNNGFLKYLCVTHWCKIDKLEE